MPKVNALHHLLPAMLLAVMLCSFPIGSRAQDSTTIKAYSDLVKVWGVLKYYSPTVNKGKTDWDSVLISKFEMITNQGGDTFYSGLNAWVKNYAPLRKGKIKGDTLIPRFSNVDSVSARSLFGLSIDKVRKGYYFTSNDCKNTLLPCYKNEKNYAPKEIWRKEYRFLALARFRNTIQYFYPYKKQLPDQWDSVLTAFIPKVLNVKNPEQFEFVLLTLSATLHDPHSQVNGSALGYQWDKAIPPLEVKWIEGKPVITAVYNDSIAKLIPAGAVIKMVDGHSAEELVNSLSSYISGDNAEYKSNSVIFNFILAGKPTTNTILTLEGADGKTMDIKLERKLLLDSLPVMVLKKIQLSSKLNDSIGYINTAYSNDKDWDKQMLAMKNTKALIVDLRGYPQFAVKSFTKYLLKRKNSPTLTQTPDLRRPGKFITTTNSTGSGKEKYKGKVVVLISEKTNSRGEYFGMLAKQGIKDVIFIGTATAGAVGNYTSTYLPGSTMISYTGTAEYYNNHETIQMKGITPDVTVTPTIKGLQAGQDEIMNKALDYLQTKLREAAIEKANKAAEAAAAKLKKQSKPASAAKP